MQGKEKILIEFGKRIRGLRKTKGMSQEMLASKSGLDRTYLSDIELGKRNISLKNISLIAFHLGVSISDLFKE